MKTLLSIILAGVVSLIALPIQAQTEKTEESPAAEKAPDTTDTAKTKETTKDETKTTKKEKTAKKTKETAKPDAGQSSMAMSKEKANSMVMQKYPGCKVIMSKQETVKGSEVWVVTFQRTGSNLSEKVMVDAQGKVSKM